MKKWRVEFDKKARDQLIGLDKQTRMRVIKFIEERILTKDNPRLLGAPLRGRLSGLWKYRMGDYRLVCKFEEDVLLLMVISVGHRKEVYKIK